jgi:predicted thioesterase
MKLLFAPGHRFEIVHTVGQNDTATFPTGEVHPVYATFAVAREAEWVCRQFVLAMRDADEEGIGTFVEVQHRSPALPGQEVRFTGILEAVQGNEVICRFEAHVGTRLVAEGRTGQKILKKERISKLFANVG